MASNAGPSNQPAATNLQLPATLNKSDRHWSKEPEYIAATVRDDPAGQSTAYTTPVWVNPIDPNDTTSYVHGQKDWNLGTHLPSVLRLFDPSESWLNEHKRNSRDALPPPKLDARGEIMRGHEGQELLDFPILPDRVGSCEEPFRFEVWRRLDPRVRAQDIMMRMYHDHKVSWQGQNNRISASLRKDHRITSWHHARKEQGEKHRRAVYDLMTANQRADNLSGGPFPPIAAMRRTGMEKDIRKEHRRRSEEAANPTASRGSGAGGSGRGRRAKAQDEGDYEEASENEEEDEEVEDQYEDADTEEESEEAEEEEQQLPTEAQEDEEAQNTDEDATKDDDASATLVNDNTEGEEADGQPLPPQILTVAPAPTERPAAETSPAPSSPAFDEIEYEAEDLDNPQWGGQSHIVLPHWEAEDRARFQHRYSAPDHEYD